MSDDQPFKASKSLSERLLRLRNYQSRDFWAMVFARPMTILLLLPVADLRWVTPNLITLVSVLLKAAGIAILVAMPSYTGGLLGAVLINLGLVFDNMDGTLARYRGNSSYLGYYLDKSVDMIGHVGVFVAIGYRTFVVTGELLDLFLPMLAITGAAVAGYCKWVAHRVETDVQLLRNLKTGELEGWVHKRVDQNPSEPPPTRSVKDWLLWLLGAIRSIFYINEVDIYFFAALFLLVGRPEFFTRYACAVYSLALIFVPALFYFKLRKLIREEGLR